MHANNGLETMQMLHLPRILLRLLPILMAVIIVPARVNSTPKPDQAAGGINNPLLLSSSLSPWLRSAAINPRQAGCWNRPWICNEGKFPPRIKKLCCRNQCVDVTSDVYNCGLCGIRCPFTWQCCRGICINTNINPFHCGRCDHKCPFRSFCVYGMCGYAQPLPPFPPKPPKPPKPPFPFPPKPPKPPKPPFPFPPKPPKPPFPPHPPAVGTN